MISATGIKKGSKILYKDEPYIVTDFQHVKPGKGGAFVRTKLKNLITNLTHEATFRSDRKFHVPDLEYRKMQYLYQDNGLYNFIDQETYDQVELSKNQIEGILDLLQEQTVYTLLYWSEKPISVNPPIHMQLKVIDTPPGVKGDTAQGAGNKPATLETGLVVQIPLFVEIGDSIKIDTRDKIYIERVKK